jgi:endonuclease/exonuclease/phosphatase family metal-dependent hydrolase
MKGIEIAERIEEIERLAALGVHSAYHAHRGTEQGIDEEPTHWHSSVGSFTIDHVFTPQEWTINSVTVGRSTPWQDRSDHAPILVEIEPN